MSKPRPASRLAKPSPPYLKTGHHALDAWQSAHAFSCYSWLCFCPHSLCRNKKPNILMIAIDDQNDWIGFSGASDGKRPTSIGWPNAAQAYQCPPIPPVQSSRTSLMIGRRPGGTGIYGLAPWFRDLRPVTLPQYLKKHGGYTTYTTGKIYHGRYGRQKTDNEFDFIGPGATGAPFLRVRKNWSPHLLAIIA